MAKKFKLSIVTPERIIYEGSAVSLIVPAALGYLGVLANHAPLVASLRSGKIIFRNETEKSQTFNYQGAGIIEVLENNVNILLRQPLPPA